MSETPEARLKAMELTLPTISPPVGSFLPAVRCGDLVFISGQIPQNIKKHDFKPVIITHFRFIFFFINCFQHIPKTGFKKLKIDIHKNGIFFRQIQLQPFR